MCLLLRDEGDGDYNPMTEKNLVLPLKSNRKEGRLKKIANGVYFEPLSSFGILFRKALSGVVMLAFFIVGSL